MSPSGISLKNGWIFQSGRNNGPHAKGGRKRVIAFWGHMRVKTNTQGRVRTAIQFKIGKTVLVADLRAARRATLRKALTGSSALVPVAAAMLLFSPEAEAVDLDRNDVRELVELGRLLYLARNIGEWEIDPETQALTALFDNGWRGVF